MIREDSSWLKLARAPASLTPRQLLANAAIATSRVGSSPNLRTLKMRGCSDIGSFPGFSTQMARAFGRRHAALHAGLLLCTDD
jgi:hypothetical protein